MALLTRDGLTAKEVGGLMSFYANVVLADQVDLSHPEGGLSSIADNKETTDGFLGSGGRSEGPHRIPTGIEIMEWPNGPAYDDSDPWTESGDPCQGFAQSDWAVNYHGQGLINHSTIVYFEYNDDDLWVQTANSEVRAVAVCSRFVSLSSIEYPNPARFTIWNKEEGGSWTILYESGWG